MNMPNVMITKKQYETRVPEFQTEGSAGCDIHADISESVSINPGCITTIPTGICMEIPHGFEAQIRPRSGLSLKTHLRVANSPGTIDSDYRGEIKVIIENNGTGVEIINPGDRIAQIVFSQVFQPVFEITHTLSETERGSGGFGSTGG